MIFARSVPPKARRAYTADAWAGILFGIHAGWILPFYLIVARDRLHTSAFLISLMTAAPFLGNLFALLWANAMEGRSKKPFVVWSGILSRGMLLLIVVANTPLKFALIVTASHFLATIAAPAYAAVMKDVYPDEHRGRIMGYIRGMMAFTMILTTAAVGPLLSVANYRWIFPIGAIFGVAASYFFSTIPTSEPTHEERASKGPLFQFLRSSFGILSDNYSFRWFALSIFTFGFGALIIVPLYPIIQVDRLHISTSQAAVLANVMGVVWMVSYILWGRYIDIKSPLRATLINTVLSMLIPLNYFFAQSVWMLLPAAAITGITAAGIELAYFNSVLQFSEGRRVSHYQALFSWLLGIRGSIAPFVGGALKQLFDGWGWDYRYIFIMSGAIMLSGALMQYVGAHRTTRHRDA
ncbi:MAG: MFS transporter [Armatimonadetes bacterium]|nr:MFS transporter [Armatimonadota bacterium]